MYVRTLLVTFGFGDAMALGAFGLEDLLAGLGVAFGGLSERCHDDALIERTGRADTINCGAVLDRQQRDDTMAPRSIGKKAMEGQGSIDRARPGARAKWQK